MIDQTFVVFRKNLEILCHLQAQTETDDTPPSFEAHGSEQLAQQFNPATRIVFVKLLAHAPDINAGANKLGRDLESARGRVRILERPGVGGNCDVKVLGDFLGKRQFLVGDKIEENLSGSRRDGIDIDEIAVTRIARRMIDRKSTRL